VARFGPVIAVNRVKGWIAAVVISAFIWAVIVVAVTQIAGLFS